jgi:hypothetical protein
MCRCLFLLSVMLVPPAGPATPKEKSAPAPLYSLPADGIWVEYDWSATSPEGEKESGTLRLSSVGSQKEAGQVCRWLEMKLTVRQGEKTSYRFRKLLIQERAFARGGPLRPFVVQGYTQRGADGPVRRLTGRQLEPLLGLGLQGSEGPLKEVAGREEVVTPLGRTSCRHVQARGTFGTRTLEYHGWLTDAVPFGWARLEIRERDGGATRTVFLAQARRRGQGARSEVDQAKAAAP